MCFGVGHGGVQVHDHGEKYGDYGGPNCVVSNYDFRLLPQYGQVETINQIINAYYQITFSDWCWVFLDGVWTITMAFALPLARPAEYLSDTRPTSSILGLHTLSSILGVLALNFGFTLLALFMLTAQDWYQCRQWTGEDVSNVSCARAFSVSKLLCHPSILTYILFLSGECHWR